MNILQKEVQMLLAELEAGEIKFSNIINFIETHYKCTPAAFKNGQQNNVATENQGSAKVLSFAKLHNLSKEETLKLFAEHYQSVLNTPTATDHQNIRQFIQHGWDGVVFETNVLQAK